MHPGCAARPRALEFNAFGVRKRRTFSVQRRPDTRVQTYIYFTRVNRRVVIVNEVVIYQKNEARSRATSFENSSCMGPAR